jgi:hypothetical protein
MTSAPHLSSEDRVEYRRLLDEALRTAHERPELTAVGRLLTAEQLRSTALDAIAIVVQAAAAEHERYAAVRSELRAPRPLPVRESLPSARTARQGARSDSPSADAPRASLLSDPSGTGAGIVAAVAVLVPVLAAIAAVIFLLVGYLLKAVSATRALADSLVGVGWFFAAVMALGIVVAGTGLVVTALRNGATQSRATGDTEPRQLAEAREAWRIALLEKGIVPFLRDALGAAEADAGAGSPQAGGGDRAGGDRAGGDRAGGDRAGGGPAGGGPGGGGTGLQTRPHTDPGRGAQAPHPLPKIGYSRPDFTSPGDDRGSARRPRYSSPDFTSPEYGGPEHQPE